MSAVPDAVVIVGAGPCGVASALALKEVGVRTPMFPARDDVVDHTSDHAKRAGLEFRFGTPVTPDWPRRNAFAGRVLHAVEYRDAEPFEDRRVLVVGPGCSGKRRHQLSPAPRLTANEVNTVRHHAEYVRSFASRVRRVASPASSKRPPPRGRRLPRGHPGRLARPG